MPGVLRTPAHFPPAWPSKENIFFFLILTVCSHADSLGTWCQDFCVFDFEVSITTQSTQHFI